FATRQQASRELQRLGEMAVPALRRTLRGRPSLEVENQIEQILIQLEEKDETTASLELVSALRALTVLEQIGSRKARQVLQKLSKGPPEGWLTKEAKAILTQFKKRTSADP